MGPELILYLLKPRLKRGDIVAMFWEYEHYTFTRSGEVNLTYLNLVFGPQSDFRHTLPFLDGAARPIPAWPRTCGTPPSLP